MEHTSLDPVQVCTLPPAALGERMAWVRAAILPYALAHERSGDVTALEFADAPGLRERLDRWIEAERDCCSGLDWRRAPTGLRGRLRVEVRGLDPDSEVAAAFARAPSSPAGSGPAATAALAAPGTGARLLRSLGFGTVLSLVVCCVLPVAAGALLGAAVAAPFLALDAPAPIAAGAALGSALAWVWSGRRQRDARAQAVADEDCGC